MKQNLWSVVTSKEVDCEHPPEALAMAKEKSDAAIDQKIHELECLLRERNKA